MWFIFSYLFAFAGDIFVRIHMFSNLAIDGDMSSPLLVLLIAGEEISI